MAWRRIAKSPDFPQRIAADRLVLRPYRYGDADHLFSYADDEQWSRYITPPHPYLREYAETFIEERINGHGNNWAGWCIDCNDRMIGSIDLILDAAHRSAEMAYSLARTHWNKGLMTEAVGATIDAAFTVDRPLNRLFARIDTRNEASARVAEKLGLKQEGVLRKSRFHKGKFIDDAIFAILRDDWKMTLPIR
jgi:ribosomal-protein-alanine N-acetyltransferase